MSSRKKPIFVTMKATDDTDVLKLPIIEQIKLLFGKVNQSEIQKLEAAEKVNRARLEMESNLIALVNRVTERMRQLGEDSVTVAISSEFIPYFDDVLNEKTGKGRFYDFTFKYPNTPILGVEYKVEVTIKIKEGMR